MRAHLAFIAVGACVAFACGGKVDDGGDSGTLGDGGLPDVAMTGQCCPPSAQPGCCMSYGGFAQGGGCSQQCDGMPSPGDPGWHLGKDSHGCAIWIEPATPTSFCGQKPPPEQCPTPADVSMFTPAPLHPPGVAKVCSSSQINGFYDACLASNATSQTCQSFTASNGPCAACLVTPDTAPSWGPLVAHQGVDELDMPGCIAIVSGDSSITSCAQSDENAIECENAACATACPITDQASAELYDQCVQSADQGGCAKYVAAECGIDAGTPAQCYVGDFKTGFTTFAALFCGAS